MTDRRPDRVYGILVRPGEVFLRDVGGRLGLPGGIFRPLAEDRKVELRAHLWDQLGIEASAIWAQGAFDYQDPAEDRPWFSGFYTVWQWQPDPAPGAGRWLSRDDVLAAGLSPSLRILLLSVLDTIAIKTT
ncbi:hypothetical protein O0235_10910 [Tepidiforma flava]|uniref:NUDIX hydrolase n=1 Tax=Tepidiforma flava TaxID=3004094 RepID=A0ABY7M414_9CHLR|nr:hypothetical protein [Tepidiforma flava]WBL35288.1 hypothetical protein O0235_10910 [Tepidiforma flava]